MAFGLDQLLDDGGFVPHGVCLLWQADILALHVGSDVLTGLSYFSIPLALMYFVHRRRDLAFGWVAVLFAFFIVACGTTHFFSIWTLWNADYALEGVIKAVTAIASLATAVTLWLLMPRLLALPSPAQLARSNIALEREVEMRRQAEIRYAGFFNNLAEALFIVAVEPAGRFRYEAINPALARATGFDPEALRGRPVADALPAEVASSVLARYAQCRDSGEGIDYEEVLTLPVGRRVFHTVLVPVEGASGRVSQILGSSRDVTERRRLQEEVSQTSKLATLGTLAAGMAHEMSQPLNIIRLWSENALARLQDAIPEREWMERTLGLVVTQTERMGKLIDHVRAFGRRDAGESQRFHAADSVRNALDLVRHPFALERIELDDRAADPMETGGAPVVVAGRPLELEQVILNLLSNARDAIEAARDAGRMAGQIQIAVCDDGDNNCTVVQVTDDGGGIDSSVLPNIFDPFFTTKEVGKGSGLGLSISYGIIDGMGGRIEAETVELDAARRGARFTITLPGQPVSPSDRELSHA